MVRRVFLTLVLLVLNFLLFAQNKDSYVIQWLNPVEFNGIKTLNFLEADHNFDLLPIFGDKVAVQHINDVMKISNTQTRVLTGDELEIIKRYELSNDWSFQSETYMDTRDFFCVFSLLPIRYNPKNDSYEKLISFDIEVFENSTKAISQEFISAPHSKMRNGEWFKLGITKTGVHKLTYQELQNMGVDVSQGVSFYGYGGRVLSEKNSTSMADDMQEIPIVIEKGDDGVFNKDDYILFYAQGPIAWFYSSEEKKFTHQKHCYSDTIFYFFCVGISNSKQITYKQEINTYVNQINCFLDNRVYENDQVNLLRSGKEWYGEEYRSLSPSYDFTFNFPNILTDSLAIIQVSGAARSNSNEFPYSYIKAYYNNTNIQSVKIKGVNFLDFNSDYALSNVNTNSFHPYSSKIKISTTYDKSQFYSAWLDYIRLSAVRKLKLVNNQQVFTNVYHSKESNRFNIENSSKSHLVWNVTDVIEPQQMHTSLDNGIMSFIDKGLKEQTYCVFKPMDAYSVSSIKKVQNQDLHGLENIEYVILCPEMFRSQAERLADYHRKNSGLNTIVVTNQQVYNEFSSGIPDITAIKNFMRHLYHHKSLSDTLQYLLLFGDGSYDNKGILGSNVNRILTYQTANSLRTSSSFPTDDYFGLLDENEGGITGFLDIGVGRIPVNTKEQASNVLNKIFNYKNQRGSYGNWRSLITLIADNDRNTYMSALEMISESVSSNYPDFNIKKIYMDAYTLETSAGADVVPDMNTAINNQINNGSLIVNYIGHGGETGLAHEQIVTIKDILSWNNIHKLPLFITATCDFTPFDKEEITSAGEQVFLSPKGGGIALFTTTRITFESSNRSINFSFYNHLYDDKDFRFGDLIKRMKNGLNSLNSHNMRKYVLIGDPALGLAVPKKGISTVTINDVSVNDVDTVNISALSKVTIKGEINDDDGSVMSNFNGVVFPIIFDKPDTVSTLNQVSGTDPFWFTVRNNIIYQGKASVKEGKFKYSFIVPKDISYKNGLGRISHYATNYKIDAFGHTSNLSVSGSLGTAIVDSKGPVLDLFMNDEDFVYGGTTNEDPILFAKLYDESGINTVGNGIGHDVLATIDNDTQNAISLNAYYEGDLDSYQSGKIKYPYSKLPTGKHVLKLKAWDVFNNSNEEQLEFVVAESEELAIKNVLNYPNPFTTHTDFYFDHNQAGQILEVLIQIFTVSGKLIKTIERNVISDGFRSNPISWNGKDDYDDPIGRGVYLYKVKVRTEGGKVATEFQKLVLLK